MPTTKDKLLPISPETATRKKKEGEKKTTRKIIAKLFVVHAYPKKQTSFVKIPKLMVLYGFLVKVRN